MNTKIVLAAFGLAALIATPAFAKHVHRAAPAYGYGPYASVNQPIVENGRPIGTDPDAAIRSELERDSVTYTTTN